MQILVPSKWTKELESDKNHSQMLQQKAKSNKTKIKKKNGNPEIKQ